MFFRFFWVADGRRSYPQINSVLKKSLFGKLCAQNILKKWNAYIKLVLNLSNILFKIGKLVIEATVSTLGMKDSSTHRPVFLSMKTKTTLFILFRGGMVVSYDQMLYIRCQYKQR